MMNKTNTFEFTNSPQTAQEFMAARMASIVLPHTLEVVRVEA